MDKVQKYNSFNTNTPSSESYRKYTHEGSVIKLLRKVTLKMSDSEWKTLKCCK
jgi:hypothetical protein